MFSPTVESFVRAERSSPSSSKRRVTAGSKRPSGADMAHTLDSWLAEWKRAKQIRPSVSSLDRISQAAFDNFMARGFPTTREEEWRFTSVAPIADSNFVLVTEPRTAGLDIAQLRLPGEVAAELVFVDGRYVAGLSRLAALPSASRAECLAAAIASPHEPTQ